LVSNPAPLHRIGCHHACAAPGTRRSSSLRSRGWSPAPPRSPPHHRDLHPALLASQGQQPVVPLLRRIQLPSPHGPFGHPKPERAPPEIYTGRSVHEDRPCSQPQLARICPFCPAVQSQATRRKLAAGCRGECLSAAASGSESGGSGVLDEPVPGPARQPHRSHPQTGTSPGGPTTPASDAPGMVADHLTAVHPPASRSYHLVGTYSHAARSGPRAAGQEGRGDAGGNQVGRPAPDPGPVRQSTLLRFATRSSAAAGTAPQTSPGRQRSAPGSTPPNSTRRRKRCVPAPPLVTKSGHRRAPGRPVPPTGAVPPSPPPRGHHR